MKKDYNGQVEHLGAESAKKKNFKPFLSQPWLFCYFFLPRKKSKQGFHKALEGDIIYLTSNVPHAISNKGVGACTYLLFNLSNLSSAGLRNCAGKLFIPVFFASSAKHK